MSDISRRAPAPIFGVQTSRKYSCACHTHSCNTQFLEVCHDWIRGQGKQHRQTDHLLQILRYYHGFQIADECKNVEIALFQRNRNSAYIYSKLVLLLSARAVETSTRPSVQQHEHAREYVNEHLTVISLEEQR